MRSLADFPGQLERHYRQIPESHRAWAPDSWDGVPSEALTAIEQVWHVLDIEVDGYQNRFRRTLAEAAPVLESLDTYRMARERRYQERDGSEALAAFRQARAQTIELLASVQPGQWQRTALFEGYGSVTLRGLVHYLCSHDQQHLSGLQWLLGKISSATARLESRP